MNNNLPTSASFLVTERCPLACSYCFEKHNNKDMSIEIIHKSLEYLSDNAKLVQNGNGFHVMIFGGEPLLRPDLVQEICEYGYKMQEKKDIKFSATVITNGTQMNDDIFWLLTQYKNKVGLTCQLSIDGNKESQDLYRVTKNGKGSFDLIEKNIERFKKIYQDKPQMLSIHGCINKKTMSKLFDNYKFFKEEWNIKNIWFMPIHEENWDKNDVVIYRDQLNKIADYMINLSIKNKDLSEIKMYTPINKCMMPYMQHNRLCGAGKNFIGITASGDIFPCHFFYFNNYNNDMKIGDIWNGIDENSKQRKKFLTYEIDKVSCPLDCEHVNCYRCMGSNWLKNKNPVEQIRGYYCEISKIEKEITDRMKKEIANLDFIDLNNKLQMTFEKSWVEQDKQYEKYINQIGEEVIFKRELNKEEKKYVSDYYDKNAIDILAKGMKLILQKVNNIEQQNQEILQKLSKE